MNIYYGGAVEAQLLAGGGGVTYEKAGALTAGATLSGADVAEHVETGGLAVTTRLSGSDVERSTFEAGSLTTTTPAVRRGRCRAR